MGHKTWPANDEPAYFEDITAPIIKAIKFAYRLQRKNRTKDIPYNGLEIGRDSRATCLKAKEQLKAENLAYSMDDQGRNALEEIIGLAIRLGIEQGRRIAMDSSFIKTLKIELLIAKIKAGEATSDSLAEVLK